MNAESSKNETRLANQDRVIQKDTPAVNYFISENVSQETPVMHLSKLQKHADSEKTLNQTSHVTPNMRQLRSSKRTSAIIEEPEANDKSKQFKTKFGGSSSIYSPAESPDQSPASKIDNNNLRPQMVEPPAIK